MNFETKKIKFFIDPLNSEGKRVKKKKGKKIKERIKLKVSCDNLLVFDVFVKSSNILEIQADELFNIGLIHSRLDQFRRLMCFKLAETYFQTSKSFLILNLKKEMLLQFWISLLSILQEFCEVVKLFRFSKKYYFLLWKNYIKDNISVLENFQEFVNAILQRIWPKAFSKSREIF